MVDGEMVRLRSRRNAAEAPTLERMERAHQRRRPPPNEDDAGGGGRGMEIA